MAKEVSSPEVSAIAARYMKDPNPHIRALAASVLTQDETPGSPTYEAVVAEAALPAEHAARVREPIADMQLVLQGDGGIRPVAPANMDAASFDAGFALGFWHGLWRR